VKPVPNDVVERQLAWRYATKKFDPAKPVAPDDWRTLERSLVLAPSSFGLQPWKFFVVTDGAMKARLRAASWNQSQVVDASHVVVFALKTGLGPADVERWIARIGQVRGTPPAALEGYKKMMVGFLAQPTERFDVDDWAARQLYIALGQFMAAAAMLGVDTCPMEGLDPVAYDEILNLGGSGYRTVVVCVAGHRAADDATASWPKVRYETRDVVAHLG